MEYKGYTLTDIETAGDGTINGVSRKDGDMLLCQGNTLAELKVDFESAVDDLLEYKGEQ